MMSKVDWVNGVCGIMVKTFLAPSDSMNSPTRVTCSVEFGWVRTRKPWCGSSVIELAPDTVHRKVLLSQQSGATAVVTDEAQVPTIADTLSTSISLRAARTPASGLVWSSSLTSWTLRPSTPPAALTSSTTAAAAFAMTGP